MESGFYSDFHFSSVMLSVLVLLYQFVDIVYLFT